MGKLFGARCVTYETGKLRKSIFSVLPLFFFVSYQQFFYHTSAATSTHMLHGSGFSNYCYNSMTFFDFNGRSSKALQLAKNTQMYYLKNHLYIVYYLVDFFYRDILVLCSKLHFLASLSACFELPVFFF